MIDINRKFRYENQKILTIQEFMTKYMVHNVNPVLTEKMINILVKQNKAQWLDTEEKPSAKKTDDLTDTTKRIDFCGINISVKDYADEFKGGNIAEAENHLNNAVRRGIAKWEAEPVVESHTSEKIEEEEQVVKGDDIAIKSSELEWKHTAQMDESEQIGITHMISRTEAVIRLKGYALLNEDLMTHSKVDTYYGEYQFYRIAGAIVGLLDTAINQISNAEEIEEYKTLALQYITLNRKLTEKIAANHDKYLTKHQTLAYIKELYGDSLENLGIISDQDFFDAWHLVNTW